MNAARAPQTLVSGYDLEGHRLRLRIGIATVGGATSQTYTV